MDSKDTNKRQRKSYKKPVLTNHGRITQLTTGGSGMMQEMAMMPNNPNRFP